MLGHGKLPEIIENLRQAAEATPDDAYLDKLFAALSPLLDYPDDESAFAYMQAGLGTMKAHKGPGAEEAALYAFTSLLGFSLEARPGSRMEKDNAALIPYYFKFLSPLQQEQTLEGLRELAEDEEFKDRAAIVVIRTLLHTATKPGQRSPSRPGLTP